MGLSFFRAESITSVILSAGPFSPTGGSSRFTEGLSGRCREGKIAGFSVGEIVFAEFQALD
ncbi:hypothetical protein UF75_2363 [Desulfosporosinus sp. I2]|uniref:Uncharacterized protein n=1 Tax=Desulfosporosinus metallidurans TaxID=1888891 RepID=A0A1Q8QIR1_9FIRM|nr:hypothetical protein [Desulfosporosinus sp. I2]KJR47282.1 hypothetical protein UF75_2363 [Desulfosporosinus sp. I2]OLN27229.1 hypothetical protein DSOL_4654 [Desulfosporosinus metallidurans]